MKKWITYIVIAILCLTLTGCDSDSNASTATTELPEGSILIYYINDDTYEFGTETYALNQEASTLEQVQDILDIMFSSTNGINTTSTTNQQRANVIASSMKMMDVRFRDGQATITVNITNEQPDTYPVVLSKAAITQTLCQLGEVEQVAFTIYDSSKVLEGGTAIEYYNDISFVDNEKEGGYLQRGIITLYFADETGNMLLEYDKSVEITTDVSLEQLVIESLIAGPMRDGYYKTIPDGTTLKKISIKDGVCYVDLSGEFNNKLDNCMDEVTIYSVVNSLCELPTINKVQFLINGEKQEFYRETIPFDGMFEMQSDIIKKETTEEE